MLCKEYCPFSEKKDWSKPEEPRIFLFLSWTGQTEVKTLLLLLKNGQVKRSVSVHYYRPFNE